MKIVVTSTYENVDESWLQWYLARLRRQGYGIHAENLEANSYSEFESQDPTSLVVARTSYKLIPEIGGQHA